MKTRRRAGFTLVELLVVITIIAILAAILVPTVYLALAKAQNAVISIELSNIDAAMKQYKLGHAYPPNFGNPTTVVKHIQAKFGRYNPTAGGVTQPPPGLDPAEALVFWLQGYSKNPVDPLKPGQRVELFDFDETRLRDADGDGFKEYYPRDAQKIPYVYFHHDSYGGLSFGGGNNGVGLVRPYTSSVIVGNFANADSYQIISAGQDGDWGVDNADKRYPAGLNYSPGDQDNVGNFSGGTLAAQIPE